MKYRRAAPKMAQQRLMGAAVVAAGVFAIAAVPAHEDGTGGLFAVAFGAYLLLSRELVVF